MHQAEEKPRKITPNRACLCQDMWTLRLTLQELSEQLPPAEQPDWWSQMWEHYVETLTDYRASLETLARKMAEAGAAAQQLLGWLAQAPDPKWAAGKQAQLLARVFAEQFEVLAAEAAPQQGQGTVGHGARAKSS
jgi:hypothetical protein